MVAQSLDGGVSDGVMEMEAWEKLLVAVETASRKVLEGAPYESAVVFSTPIGGTCYSSHLIISGGTWDEDILAFSAKELFSHNLGELAQFPTSSGSVLNVRIDLYTDPALGGDEKSSILGQIVKSL